MKGFYHHIKEAIRLNWERKALYSNLSQGKTRSLSLTLVALERMCLPLALYFDLRAKSFNSKGIHVVKDDFVPMKVVPYNTPVKYTSVIEANSELSVKKEIANYLETVNYKISDRKNIEGQLRESKSFLANIEHLEVTSEIHLAMLKHLTESMVFILSNGMQYAEQSNDKSIKLTAQLIALHKLGLRYSLMIDKMASQFHKDGIGIIVNDLPKIIN